LQEEMVRRLIELQLPHDEILSLTIGFELGRTLGVALCLGLAWLLLAITGALREREKSLMLKFHDELRKLEETSNGASL
jgi:hypothetical protein